MLGILVPAVFVDYNMLFVPCLLVCYSADSFIVLYFLLWFFTVSSSFLALCGYFLGFSFIMYHKYRICICTCFCQVPKDTSNELPFKLNSVLGFEATQIVWTSFKTHLWDNNIYKFSGELVVNSFIQSQIQKDKFSTIALWVVEMFFMLTHYYNATSHLA